MKYFFALSVLIGIVSCAKPITKQFYLLSYQPDQLTDRLQEDPYPFTVRLRPFEIEKAYAKPNIVYRRSPYELEYYGYHHWAVRPTDMMTDQIYSHLEGLKLVQSTVRRLDEKGKPDYELSGTVLAMEEYDSEDIWFAHLKIRMTLVRLSDGVVVYNRLYDQRKIVPTHTPLHVVRTLSELTDYFASSLMNELDRTFNEEMKNRGGTK